MACFPTETLWPLSARAGERPRLLREGVITEAEVAAAWP